MKIQQSHKGKSPIIFIDNSLEKFVKMPIFQDKVDEANKLLKKTGIPKFPVTKLKSQK